MIEIIIIIYLAGILITWLNIGMPDGDIIDALACAMWPFIIIGYIFRFFNKIIRRSK